MNIKLLGDHLIVRPIPREKIGHIELPESLRDNPNVGGPKWYWVMVVGPGRRNRNGVHIPIECEYGDRVVCESYTKGAEEFRNEHGDLMITADQILLVLPKAPVEGVKPNGQENEEGKGQVR